MDDSPAARRALDHAFDTFPDARITVLHAVDPVEAVYGGADPDPDGTPEEREPPLFEDVRRESEERGRAVETAIATADDGVADAIVDYAGREGVDAVVLGSHGREGLERALVGSVAESVVRRAPVPVTVVH